MSRRFRWQNSLPWLGFGFALVACGIDPEIPERKGGAPPVGMGATLSGGGVSDGNSAMRFGDGAAITDIHSGGSGSGSGTPLAEELGGFDSGGADDGAVRG